MNSKEGTSKMRAVVLETRGSEAAILVNDGTVRIARGNFRVGETFEYKEQAKPTKRQWAAAAAAMVILLAGSTGMWIDRNYVTYAEVSLDVNPSIVYTLNKRDRVLGVRAVNEDAQSIVESLAEDNIRFMPLTDAVEKTMALLEDEGYLAEVTDDYVLLNVSADDKERQSRLSGDVENAMVHVKEQDSTLEYRIDHSDRATAKQAKDSGMSIGRYSIWRDEQGRPNETPDSQDEKNGRVVDVEPAAEQTMKDYEEKSVRELLGHKPEQDQESVRIAAGTQDAPTVQIQPEDEMTKPEGEMTQPEGEMPKPQDEPNEPIEPENGMAKPEGEMTQPEDGMTKPQDGPNEPTKPEDGNHTQPVDEEKPDGNVQEQSEYPQQAVNDQEPAVYGQEQGVEYQGSAVDAHSIDKDHDDPADPPAVEDGHEVFELLIVTDHEKMPEQPVVIDQPLESDPQDEKQSIGADSAEVIGDKEPSKNEDLPVAEDGEKPGYGDKEPPEDRDMESSVAEDVEMPKGAGNEPSMGDGKEQSKGEDKTLPKDDDKEPPTDDGKTSSKTGDKSASAGKNKAPSTKGDSKPQDKPQENSRGGKADGNGNRNSSSGGGPSRGGGGNPGGGSNPGGRGNPGGGKGNPGGGGGGQPGGGGNPGGGGPGPR